MSRKEDQCAGFVEFQFLDGERIVTLGGNVFQTNAEVEAAWASIPDFPGESAFMADRLDTHRGLVDTKQVSAETCEILLRRSIASLISEGRAMREALVKKMPTGQKD